MSPDEIFASQMWVWPDPMLKRDAQGRVIVVNAAFLALYGGQAQDWAGHPVSGWPEPSAAGTSNRFTAKVPRGDGQETIYDWLEFTLPDGSALAMARDVTEHVAQAPAAPAAAATPPVTTFDAAEAAVPPAAADPVMPTESAATEIDQMSVNSFIEESVPSEAPVIPKPEATPAPPIAEAPPQVATQTPAQPIAQPYQPPAQAVQQAPVQPPAAEPVQAPPLAEPYTPPVAPEAVTPPAAMQAAAVPPAPAAPVAQPAAPTAAMGHIPAHPAQTPQAVQPAAPAAAPVPPAPVAHNPATQMAPTPPVPGQPVQTASVPPQLGAPTEDDRQYERRALPIEDGDAVLGNNWRDAVIAKAVGMDDLSEKREADEQAAREAAEAEAVAAKAGTGPKILLAEDNAINALLTRTLLEAEGCTVDVVEDGALAVEAMKNGQYDMIFMDMRMPNMDGLEATRKIRAMGHGADTLPIVALTANAFDDDRNACFDSGMNDFMTKPVAAEELSDMVITHTGNKEARLAS